MKQEIAMKNGSILSIRQAEEEDAEAILSFIESASKETDFLTFGPGEFQVSLSEQRAFLKSYKESPTSLYLIGLIEETIAASLSFTTGTRRRLVHYGEIGMSVGNQFWNLGIGGAMMDYLLAWAQKHGTIKKINLGVRTDNLRAIHLYLNKGFEVEGIIRRSICINGEYFDHYCMGRCID